MLTTEETTQLEYVDAELPTWLLDVVQQQEVPSAPVEALLQEAQETRSAADSLALSAKQHDLRDPHAILSLANYCRNRGEELSGAQAEDKRQHFATAGWMFQEVMEHLPGTIDYDKAIYNSMCVFVETYEELTIGTTQEFRDRRSQVVSGFKASVTENVWDSLKQYFESAFNGRYYYEFVNLLDRDIRTGVVDSAEAHVPDRLQMALEASKWKDHHDANWNPKYTSRIEAATFEIKAEQEQDQGTSASLYASAARKWGGVDDASRAARCEALAWQARLADMVMKSTSPNEFWEDAILEASGQVDAEWYDWASSNYDNTPEIVAVQLIVVDALHKRSDPFPPSGELSEMIGRLWPRLRQRGRTWCLIASGIETTRRLTLYSSDLGASQDSEPTLPGQERLGYDELAEKLSDALYLELKQLLSKPAPSSEAEILDIRTVDDLCRALELGQITTEYELVEFKAAIRDQNHEHLDYAKHFVGLLNRVTDEAAFVVFGVRNEDCAVTGIGPELQELGGNAMDAAQQMILQHLQGRIGPEALWQEVVNDLRPHHREIAGQMVLVWQVPAVHKDDAFYLTLGDQGEEFYRRVHGSSQPIPARQIKAFLESRRKFASVSNDSPQA